MCQLNIQLYNCRSVTLFFQPTLTMENETIETFLNRLKMDDWVAKFKEQKIELFWLLKSDEKDLKEILKELNLTIGHRWKIIQEIRVLKQRK